MRQGRTASIGGAILVLLMAGGCGDFAFAPTPPSTAPAMSQVFPSRGLANEHTTIQIYGTRFQPGAAVHLGGVALTAAVESTSRIVASAPPHERGNVELVVTNPDGGAARLSGGFTYVSTLAELGYLRIRIGESVTSTLANVPESCTFESVPCLSLFVDGPPAELIALELTPEESGRLIGLFQELPSRAPRDYPRRLNVLGGQRVFIVGDRSDFTVTARVPDTH